MKERNERMIQQDMWNMQHEIHLPMALKVGVMLLFLATSFLCVFTPALKFL